MKETKFKQTEIGEIPEDWEATKKSKRYVRTMDAREQSANDSKKKVKSKYSSFKNGI